MGKYKLEDNENVKKVKAEFARSKKKAKAVSDDFKKFAFKGNILELATGVIIGNAFTKIVNSLVNQIIIPSISVFTDKVNFSSWFTALDGNTYASVEEAQKAGATVIDWGTFVTNVVDFFIIAIVTFIFIKFISSLKKKEAVTETKVEQVTTKTCPYCYTSIHKDATRCPNCTSELEK